MRIFLLLMLFHWSIPQSHASSDDSTITSIEFHFQDSQVPPLFNRSYDLYLAVDTASFIHVRSYKDYLMQRPFQLDSLALVQWDSLASEAKHLQERGDHLTPGASGGRSFSLKLYSGATLMHELKWDSLRSLSDETEHFIEYFHSLVPKTVQAELNALNVSFY